MQKTFKKTVSLLMCVLMVLSCFHVSVFMDLGAIIAQAADTSITAGDINGDGSVNNKDLTRLMKYISGEDVDVVAVTVDTNGDGNVNNKDLTRLMKYISGEDVEIFPKGCMHELVLIEEVNATCEEVGHIAYWKCSLCEDLFVDETGATKITLDETVIEKLPHTEETIPGYPATLTKEGLTDGIKCSVCDKVIKEQEIIPISEYEIEYVISGNDTYLTKLMQEGKIENTNPVTYSTEKGTGRLDELVVPGYTFEGWYDASGASGILIRQIEPGTTGKQKLYAKWTKEVYTIQFDSPDIPWDSITYTVDQGTPLTNPSHFGYTFVGWSNNDGFIINRIKPGTTGNMVLHANWTSDRKKAVSYSDYGEPIIIEDSDNGQFLFVYDIGRIENVPLSAVDKEMGKTKSEGIEINRTFEVSDYVSNEDMDSVVSSVSNATTKSSGWTLSEEWEMLYQEGTTDNEKQIKSEERTDAEGKVVGGNYFVSNSSGGSSFSSVESGGSSSSSAKVTTENSFGINSSYDQSTEKYCDAKLSVENKTEVGAEISVPVKIAKVGASVKNTTTVGAEVSSGRKDNTAFHTDSSVSGYVGTVNTTDSSSYYNTVANEESNWNSTSGYEQSHETSIDSSVTNAIATELAKTTTYNITEALSGGKETDYHLDESITEDNEYSHAAKFAKGSSNKTTVEYKAKASAYGYYRLVMAATVHVYGVVGYDVATSSYYTYTYNVLSDDRSLYLDYSKDTASFDDCENGLVTFEIPYEVNEYIIGVTSETKELTYGTNDTVTEFNPTETFEGTVVVPQYQSADNGDGTYSAIKVTKIDANAFAGNTEIKTVILPLYVTEIPDGAFAGCTNLETVIAYGVTKIGANAFKGCSSLKSFMIDNHITELGANAFAETHQECAISVMAANSSVADAAIASGAKNITLNLSKMTDSYDNKKIEIKDDVTYFSLVSDGRAYKNLQIVSAASETFISNIKFTDNADTPMKISSSKITLARVTVEKAPGFALIVEANDADIKLYQNNVLESSGDNAVMTKNTTLSKMNTKYDGKMILTGNYLVCGSVTNHSSFVVYDSGELKTIDSGTFDDYLTSSVLTFDANGGSVSEASRVVYYGQKYGTLPVPTREHYSFLGWFTDASNGTEITSETPVTALVNQTIYAHWSRNTYKVNFNANGGSVSPESKNVESGATYGGLPTPTRTHYTFIGWFTDALNGTKVTTETPVTVLADHTIYAHWSRNTYKVNFNANGGSVGTSSKTVESGATYGDLPTPTRTGWTFKGWFTSSSGGSQISANSTVALSSEQTLYARWEVNSYTVSWSGVSNCTITVNRTSSPNKGAATGSVSNGAPIYYGDVLSISYVASTGYSISSKGSTSITVTRNVTKSDIWSTVSANSYTYSIVYQSVNGTSLGSSSATYKFGTTNTISAPAKDGYTTPSSQSVKWDATSKTITFKYGIAGVSNGAVSGSLCSSPNVPYSFRAEYQNRTKNSVQVRIVWTSTMKAYNYCSYGQNLRIISPVNSGNTQFIGYGTWSSGVNYDRNATGTTDWVTISLNTTNKTSVGLQVYYFQTNSQGTDMTAYYDAYGGNYGITVNIPAY